MHAYALYALKHPVYDPLTIPRGDYYWRVGYRSFALTVNIGME